MSDIKGMKEVEIEHKQRTKAVIGIIKYLIYDMNRSVMSRNNNS